MLPSAGFYHERAQMGPPLLPRELRQRARETIVQSIVELEEIRITR
jgi:hypothetical protein